MREVFPADWPNGEKVGFPLFPDDSGEHLLFRKEVGAEKPEVMHWDAASCIWTSQKGEAYPSDKIASLYSYRCACLDASGLNRLRARDFKFSANICEAICEAYLLGGDDALNLQGDINLAGSMLNGSRAACLLNTIFLQVEKDIQSQNSVDPNRKWMVEKAAIALCINRFGNRPNWELSDWEKILEWPIYLQIARMTLSSVLT